MKIRLAHMFAFVFLGVIATSAQTREVRINLVDPAGAAVVDARVRAASGKSELKLCSKDDDAFVCTVADSGGVRFDITAKGFKPLKVEYAEKDITCCEYVFVLQIEPVRENVVTVMRSGFVIENTPDTFRRRPSRIRVPSGSVSISSTL
ncbi:MAG: hypothetical protein ABL984_16000 [Pyrinomonadaceae bacterium]